MQADNNPTIVWLFDIDGTLIRSGGAGGLAMGSALEACFGVPPDIAGVEFSGRTDRGIVEDLFELHNIDVTPDNMQAMLEWYRGKLPAALKRCGGEILPGVVDWLERIRNDSDSRLGLLTGNMQTTAQEKLDHFGLSHYFTFGGYGDVHRERKLVAADARIAASRAVGQEIDPSRVWVVGDTPHDISCSRSQGFNVICTATGGYSYEELSLHSPDILIQSLHDDAILAKILARER